MELLYLGLAFLLMTVLICVYALPKAFDYVQDQINSIQQQLAILEHGIINVRQNLYKTQVKYESLGAELEQKHAALPKTLKTYSNDIMSGLDEKVKHFKDQMEKMHISAVQNQQSQYMKAYILKAVHSKLSEQLKGNQVMHKIAVQNIVLECKKTFQ